MPEKFNPNQINIVTLLAEYLSHTTIGNISKFLLPSENLNFIEYLSSKYIVRLKEDRDPALDLMGEMKPDAE
jgi:hypothetical protein